MKYFILILFILLITQTLILIVFVIQSMRQRKNISLKPTDSSKDSLSLILDGFDVIIAAREDIDLVRNCLLNVQDCGFKHIILCLDGDNASANILSREFPNIRITSNETSIGKIKSQLKCLELAKHDSVLILDADILLIPHTIPAFVKHFKENRIDFLCPYSIGRSHKNSILFKIAESDRFMRQRIVRAGRDAFGVSNLSGYCMLADRKKYKAIIDGNAIQDDVIATINLLNNRYTVSTYHHAVCSEVERASFKSYVLQKTRWTAGNIVLLSSYYKLFQTASFTKAFAFTSSFLLWYWALWIDFIAFVFGFVNPILFFPLVIELSIKYFALNHVSRHSCKILSNFLYVIVWPAFSTLCLVLSPYYLSGRIIEQKTRR